MVMYGVDIGEYVIRSYTLFKLHFLLLYESNFTDTLLTWEVPLSVSHHFAFSYYSWGSQGKNIEVVCHSLLQWTTFYQVTEIQSQI